MFYFKKQDWRTDFYEAQTPAGALRLELTSSAEGELENVRLLGNGEQLQLHLKEDWWYTVKGQAREVAAPIREAVRQLIDKHYCVGERLY